MRRPRILNERQTRLAAVDCGTNSLRLLIGELANNEVPAVGFTEVGRYAEIVRLGTGVDHTGKFDEAALERVSATLKRFAEIVRATHATQIKFVATSAARDATNQNELFDLVERILDTEVIVLSGLEEAHLSAVGALSTPTISSHERALVIDVGGGSTELTVAHQGATEYATSMDLGAVRLTERHVSSALRPLSRDEARAIRAHVQTSLTKAEPPVERLQVIVGVSSTAQAISQHAARWFHNGSTPRKTSPDPGVTTNSIDTTLRACDDLILLSTQELMRLPYIPTGLEALLPTGAIIWSEILRHVKSKNKALTEFHVSRRDLLDGVLSELFEELSGDLRP